MPDQHDARPLGHVAVVGHVQDQSFHRPALDEPVEDTQGGLQIVRAPIHREPDRQAQRVHTLSASLTGDSAIAAFSAAIRASQLCAASTNSWASSTRRAAPALVPDGVGSV